MDEQNPQPRIGLSFAAGIGFTTTLVAATILASADATTTEGLAVMAVITAAAGWYFVWTGALVTAGLAWLMLDGFVEDRYAILRWHGTRDLVELAVLAATALTVRALCEIELTTARKPQPSEDGMRDVIFILLTIGIFAVLALIARGVEKL